MVVLKKIKASTLVETITAAVIIVIVFSIALLTLNNVFAHKIKNDTSRIDNYLNELVYTYRNKALVVPYNNEYGNWEIKIEKSDKESISWVVFKAVHLQTKKSVVKKLIYELK